MTSDNAGVEPNSVGVMEFKIPPRRYRSEVPGAKGRDAESKPVNETAQPSHGDPRLRFSQPDDIFQIRVSLIDVEPPIWRRVLVPQELTLPRLHSVLQAVMGWTDSHLHQFNVGDLRFAEPDKEFEPGPIDYRRLALNQIVPRRGSTCIYEYDFGDSWEHLIEVEDELPIDTVADPLPRCLAGERACPPEDCGGPDGYAEFLKALRHLNHPEHDGLVEWAGGDFDPEAFDIERVNRILARHAQRPRPGPHRSPRRQSH